MSPMSKKFEAILRLVHFARRWATRMDCPEFFQSKEAAAELDLQYRYLEQTFQHLVSVGVLESKRGPIGGYRIADYGLAIDLAGLWQICHPSRDLFFVMSKYWTGVSIEAALADLAIGRLEHAIAHGYSSANPAPEIAS